MEAALGDQATTMSRDLCGIFHVSMRTSNNPHWPSTQQVQAETYYAFLIQSINKQIAKVVRAHVMTIDAYMGLNFVLSAE